MEFIYFMLRYTPFWAIPIALINSRFAYYYWLRGYTIPPILFGFCSVFSAFFLFLWVWSGGPDKIVPFVNELVRNF